jgi:hypothetical protein
MNDLIQQLIAQLNVDEAQARGGAGLAFQVAEDKLGESFSAVTDALPWVRDLIGEAPATGGGMGAMLGGLASSLGGGSLGNLAEVVDGMRKLNLDPGTFRQFVPVILEVVQAKAGPEVARLLASVVNPDAG